MPGLDERQATAAAQARPPPSRPRTLQEDPRHHADGRDARARVARVRVSRLTTRTAALAPAWWRRTTPLVALVRLVLGGPRRAALGPLWPRCQPSALRLPSAPAWLPTTP